MSPAHLYRLPPDPGYGSPRNPEVRTRGWIYRRQHGLVHSYWRFGTAYLFHIKGSSSPRRFLGKACLTPWPMKMRPIGCPETSETVSLRCLTWQKSEDVINTAAEACSHADTKTFTLFHPAYFSHFTTVVECNGSFLQKALFSEPPVSCCFVSLLWMSLIAIVQWSKLVTKSKINTEFYVIFSVHCSHRCI